MSPEGKWSWRLSSIYSLHLFTICHCVASHTTRTTPKHSFIPDKFMLTLRNGPLNYYLPYVVSAGWTAKLNAVPPMSYMIFFNSIS
ncbi:hypothetical protein BDZ94DRAFT_1245952 [Collybia nuda]|uniref:Secreted protein n=1 Tax=Collybia nuda TaxID=64659 RepID=A0A9P5YJC5_9AGAR|nr:hypothetical protein BDZ94DRAFT_1245952 [Collybia nuda]